MRDTIYGDLQNMEVVTMTTNEREPKREKQSNDMIVMMML
jgi:hypothetical protein